MTGPTRHCQGGVAVAEIERQRSCEMKEAGKTRKERLAAALRENLRKRKAQARELAAPPAPPPPKD
jgi:hypothetical protein